MQRVDAVVRETAGRDRLMTTARRLFTRRGASNVGINEVIAAAGVARMTLYNNFGSKDALTAAVYEEMTQRALRDLADMDTVGKSEEANILAVFDHFDRSEGDADYRGCPFTHATLQPAEASGAIHTIVRTYKRALREHVFGLLNEDRRDRGELADQIVLLLDGAVTEAYLGGVKTPIATGKRAAAALLGSSR